ncbi:MAG: type II toxin-antitoxin system PemK/MazF family toxin [Candidatus Peregrinibacteria bacterium]
MKIKQFHIYLANLDPSFGTEPGKTRPVVVIQSDLLNALDHHSTLICPLTRRVVPGGHPLRLHLPKKETNLKEDSDILVDQIRAIDNQRIQKKIGRLRASHIEQLVKNLQILLFE